MSEKKIGDRFFKAGDALATRAIKLQVRLVKLLGPAIDNLAVIFGAGSEAESDAAAIKAIGDIAERIDPDDMVDLIQDIFEFGMISYTGKGDWSPIDIDLEFSGANAKDLFPALVFVLAETLGDFFSGFRANGRPASRAKG